MITCALCGKQFRSITNTHLLRAHGIATAEYVARFGKTLVSEETRELKRRDGGIDWEIVGLGKAPDSLIALDIGASRRRIAYERKKRGIPAFGGLILTQEDNPCRSQYEAMYDAYLHWSGIEHQHEVRVHGLPYIADFLVNGAYTEIVGMVPFPKYTKKLARKRAAYLAANIAVVWMSRQSVIELYEQCPVKVRYRTERVCQRCGKITHDLVRGVCRVCYMHVWRSEGKEVRCKQCGRGFVRAGKSRQKYCSTDCYAQSMKCIDWPSTEWLEEAATHKPLRQIADSLGVKPGALYQHMYRQRKRRDTATPQLVSDFVADRL